MAMDQDEKLMDAVQAVDKKIFANKDSLSKEQLSKLPQSCQELYNYKCKYNVGKDGTNVTFYPSQHLYDKNGNFKIGSDNKYSGLQFSELNGACSLVASKMNCDKVEAAFMDQSKTLNGKSKVLKNHEWSMRHGFIQATELAWSQHYPLKIDPTHIWLMVLQGVALNVDANAEKLRKKWVQHDGKKELLVRDDTFIKGARERNDWSSVISRFCQQIDENTNKGTVGLLEADFSNATSNDQIAAKITIMDICKNYFEYTFMTMCGFPQITLTGTKDDWIKLYSKTQKVLSTKVDEKFGKEWSNALLPILKRFVQVYDGEIDCLFWNSMIKRGAQHGSGGWSWYSGWINVFFPYIGKQSNKFCVPYNGNADYIAKGLEEAGQGNDVNKYPYGLASAPVKWKYYSLEFKLKFISGFVGVSVDEKTKELSPMVGWVIGEQSKQNSETMAKFKNQFANNKNLISNK